MWSAKRCRTMPKKKNAPAMMPDQSVTLSSKFFDEIQGEMNAATKVILNKSILHFAISLHNPFVTRFMQFSVC